jgi:hypothetical protein
MTDLWWNKHYKYRKQITFDLTKGDFSGHYARCYLPKSAVNNGKVRPDFSDIRVVVNGVTVIPISQVLIENSTDHIIVRFVYPDSNLIEYSLEEDARFYVYYGDIYCESPEAYTPSDPLPELDTLIDGYTYGDLDVSEYAETVSVTSNDSRIGITRPGDDWVPFYNDTLLTNGDKLNAKISFQFYGDSVGLFAGVSYCSGIISVTIDGEEYEVDLYTDDQDLISEGVVEVFRATGLDSSLHNITLENQGKRSVRARDFTPSAIEGAGEDFVSFINENISIASYAEPIIISSFGFSAYAVGMLSGEESVETFKWNSKIGSIV